MGELNLGGCTSLTSIGNRAFYGCDGLTSGTTYTVTAIAGGGYNYAVPKFRARVQKQKICFWICNYI